MRRSYTAEQKNKIVMEFRAGESAASVGKRNGVGGAMIYQWNKQHKELGGFTDAATPAAPKKKSGAPRRGDSPSTALVQAAQSALLPPQQPANMEHDREYELRFLRAEVLRLRRAFQAYMLNGSAHDL